MKKGKSFNLHFRRKREGKTDYRSRLNLLTSGKPRIVIRRMLNNFSVQIVNYNGKMDTVLLSSSSRELLKYGWKGHRGNLPSAYLTGFLCGLKAKKKGITSGVSDLGVARVVKGSSIFASMKGLKDAGFNLPVREDFLPSEDRIMGKHIAEYAKKLGQKSGSQFSVYLKSKLPVNDFSLHFLEVKKKILEKWQ